MVGIKKTFFSKKLALLGIKKGQRVYKVKLGWRRTSISSKPKVNYKIGKRSVKKNTNLYITKNRDFIKRLAKL